MARQSLSRYLPWLVTAPAAILAWPFSAWASAGFGVLFVLGWVDFKQDKQAVRRNYPLTGRLRYALEYIRPELRQYFLEDDEQKLPFSRNQKSTRGMPPRARSGSTSTSLRVARAAPSQACASG